MRSPETERLLKEVLEDGEYAEFRARMLRESRAAFRAERRRRPVAMWLALAAAGLLAATLAWRASVKPGTELAAVPVPPSSAAPAMEGLQVRTAPAPEGWVLRTVSAPAVVATVTTRPAGVLAVRTVGGGYEVIDDRELLALVAPEGGGFVTDASGARRLYVAQAH